MSSRDQYPQFSRETCASSESTVRAPPSADQSGGDPNQRGGIPPRRAFASDRDQPGSAIEYPTVYHKDRICRHEQTLRPGEREERMKERDGREFLAPQGSPFFDIWASAGDRQDAQRALRWVATAERGLPSLARPAQVPVPLLRRHPGIDGRSRAVGFGGPDRVAMRSSPRSLELGRQGRRIASSMVAAFRGSRLDTSAAGSVCSPRSDHLLT